MGKLLGMPEWLAVTIWVVAALIFVLTYSNWKGRRQLRTLATKRPNLLHAEFVALLTEAVDSDIAEWMWNTLAVYYRPQTPHPDDDLIKDAWIDSDDIAMDWLPRFADERGLDWKTWPDWPLDWPLTVRNYARWLQLGLS